MDVKEPAWFFGVAGVIVAYLLYIVFRKRKGDRPGTTIREPEL